MLEDIEKFDEIVDNVNVKSLLHAFNNFEEFRKNTKTSQEKAGVIQAFEYCYELAWKTMRRLLQNRGVTTSSPRETFRAAALEGFIKDPEIWFVFLKMRNITTHTYNEADAEEVLSIKEKFSEEVYSFLRSIQKK